MNRLEHNPLHLSRAGILMAVWGVLILVAGVATQYYYPSIEAVLQWWAIVTVIGLAVQAACELRDQPLNFLAWVAAMAVGWVFTLWAVSPGVGLFADLTPVWLILLGLAYIPTAFQIDRRYWLFAALHLALGALMELSVRGVFVVGFLNSYSSLILGLVGGGSMIAGAALARIKYAEARSEARLSHQSSA
jgi:hypothetical protein